MMSNIITNALERVCPEVGPKLTLGKDSPCIFARHLQAWTSMLNEQPGPLGCKVFNLACVVCTFWPDCLCTLPGPCGSAPELTATKASSDVAPSTKTPLGTCGCSGTVEGASSGAGKSGGSGAIAASALPTSTAAGVATTAETEAAMGLNLAAHKSWLP